MREHNLSNCLSQPSGKALPLNFHKAACFNEPLFLFYSSVDDHSLDNLNHLNWRGAIKNESEPSLVDFKTMKPMFLACYLLDSC